MTNEIVTIQTLLEKINALEERIKVLETKEPTKSQKSSSLQLSSLYTPTINYLDWIKTLEPSQDHMENIFTQGFIQGISIIICELIEQSIQPPIHINSNKKNQFYIFQNDKWCQIDKKQFEMFIDLIQSKLFKLFKKWKEDNPKYALEEYSELLSKYHQNILGTKYPKITTLQRIKTSVYTSLL